ncbi:glycosyltransferase [Ruegeria atlantica]|uniref:Hyaluronan synthase n=1 Tax=Ruegeria atlantica TaxID=81569 RepID=A0A0P1E5J1_9RHOB|nr:glycosyltransferase [Ruegeria atlantica]CUH42699.1 Hyaluronan synthase [Ruegeria atlantica]
MNNPELENPTSYFVSAQAFEPVNFQTMSTWVEHTPFAAWLIEAHRPKTLVELGTMHGVSYFAFCHAIQRLGLSTRAFAIDTWEGDPHTQHYGEDVWDLASGYNTSHFSKFSNLIRRNFDDAVDEFDEGEIDLLHIDGYHTYEAVRHDFETWKPKLSDRAVVLFHDTQITKGDFGVYRFWEEIRSTAPSFEFHHGCGLGVLAVGDKASDGVLRLAAASDDPETTTRVRRIYETLGRGVSDSIALLNRSEETTNLRGEVAGLQRHAVSLQEVLQNKTLEIENVERDIAQLSQFNTDLVETINHHSHELRRRKDLQARRDRRRLKSRLKRLLQSLSGSKRKKELLRVTPEEKELLATGLFDAKWYTAKYADVLNSKVRPALHYLKHGATEGRNPSADFDTAIYLEENPDAGVSGLNPLVHYACIGHRRPRNKDTSIRCEPPAEPGSVSFAVDPLISIVTPVYNVDPDLLRKAVHSVERQTYGNWEICLCDDGSTREDTKETLRNLAVESDRIKVKWSSQNEGIAKATNAAIALAEGEFVGFLDNDDELHPSCLEEYVAVINDQPSVEAIYSDENKIDLEGRQSQPFLKPDWSPRYFLEAMYVGHFLLIRRDILQKIGGADPDFDGVQDFELMLRVSEVAEQIVHIPKVLYHWRMIPGSVASDSEAKPGLTKLQAAATAGHNSRTQRNAVVTPHPNKPHRVIVGPRKTGANPLVSIIIPTRDAFVHIDRCLTSIFTKTDYPEFEVIVVDTGTTDQDALDAMAKHPILKEDYKGLFNYSRANNQGVARSRGEYLVFLNNDTEVVDDQWLNRLVFELADPGVGVVGPTLLYPDGTIQHAGVSLGLRGTADHVLRHRQPEEDGYYGSLSCAREVSAVSFACAMVRARDFHEIGGLEEFYGTHYQDVDYCLRVLENGQRVIFTPHTRLIHFESVSRGNDYDYLDRGVLRDRWAAEIASGDRYSRWEEN